MNGADSGEGRPKGNILNSRSQATFVTPSSPAQILPAPPSLRLKEPRPSGTWPPSGRQPSPAGVPRIASHDQYAADQGREMQIALKEWLEFCLLRKIRLRIEERFDSRQFFSTLIFVEANWFEMLHGGRSNCSSECGVLCDINYVDNLFHVIQGEIDPEIIGPSPDVKVAISQLLGFLHRVRVAPPVLEMLELCVDPAYILGT